MLVFPDDSLAPSRGEVPEVKEVVDGCRLGGGPEDQDPPPEEAADLLVYVTTGGSKCLQIFFHIFKSLFQLFLVKMCIQICWVIMYDFELFI